MCELHPPHLLLPRALQPLDAHLQCGVADRVLLGSRGALPLVQLRRLIRDVQLVHQALVLRICSAKKTSGVQCHGADVGAALHHVLEELRWRTERVVGELEDVGGLVHVHFLELGL